MLAKETQMPWDRIEIALGIGIVIACGIAGYGLAGIHAGVGFF